MGVSSSCGSSLLSVTASFNSPIVFLSANLYVWEKQGRLLSASLLAIHTCCHNSYLLPSQISIWVFFFCNSSLQPSQYLKLAHLHLAYDSSLVLSQMGVTIWKKPTFVAEQNFLDLFWGVIWTKRSERIRSHKEILQIADFLLEWKKLDLSWKRNKHQSEERESYCCLDVIWLDEKQQQQQQQSCVRHDRIPDLKWKIIHVSLI